MLINCFFFLFKGFVPGVLAILNMAAKMRKWKMTRFFFNMTSLCDKHCILLLVY